MTPFGSAMVPSILYMLISNPDSAKILSENHMKITIGGGSLTKGLAEKARAMGIETVVGYGMSESAPLLTLSTFTKKVRDPPPMVIFMWFSERILAESGFDMSM